MKSPKLFLNKCAEIHQDLSGFCILPSDQGCHLPAINPDVPSHVACKLVLPLFPLNTSVFPRDGGVTAVWETLSRTGRLAHQLPLCLQRKYLSRPATMVTVWSLAVLPCHVSTCPFGVKDLGAVGCLGWHFLQCQGTFLRQSSHLHYLTVLSISVYIFEHGNSEAARIYMEYTYAIWDLIWILCVCVCVCRCIHKFLNLWAFKGKFSLWCPKSFFK